MASVPISGPGSIVIANNMREARLNGMSRNMATPSTYYWFYQKVRNGGPWDYKNSTHILLHLVTSTSELPVLRQVSLQPSFLWGQAGLKAGQVPQNRNGENGTKSRLTETTQRTNATSEKESSMPFKTAIKWTHRLVTVSLLALVIGFLWLNHQPNQRKSDELQRVYKLSDSVWLYMTVNNQGGTTVPTIYRYYLSGALSGKDADIIHQLAMKYPIIEGTGTITSASIDTSGEVKIAYSGKVISIENNITDLRFSVKP